MPDQNQPKNPLAQTDPSSIEELLSRDPLSLSETDAAENTRLMVQALRAERITWEEEKNKAKLTGKKVSGNSTKKLQKQAALDAIKSGKATIDLSAIIGGGKKK